MRRQLLLILGLLFLPNLSFAQTCSPNGYSVMTINGVFTDERGAQDNKEALGQYLGKNYKGENIKLDYLLNPSHIAGFGDMIDSALQKMADNSAVNDYDFTNMLSDASKKIGTQKVLLVAHSQGNFYANSFYDSVAETVRPDRSVGAWGIPAQSIGVYGVAVPANRVAGNGLWLTSDTDKVIAGLVGHTTFGAIRKPNIHIDNTTDDDILGHDFSRVYLKYQGARIVADIDASLDKLQSDPSTSLRASKPCMNLPKLTLPETVAHNIVGVTYAVADPFAHGLKSTVVTAAETPANIAHVASAVGGVIANNLFLTPENAYAMTVSTQAVQWNHDFLNGKVAIAPIVMPNTLVLATSDVARIARTQSPTPAQMALAKVDSSTSFDNTQDKSLRANNSKQIADLMRQIAEMQALRAKMLAEEAAPKTPDVKVAPTSGVKESHSTDSTGSPKSSSGQAKPTASVANVFNLIQTSNAYQPGFGGGGSGVPVVSITSDVKDAPTSDVIETPTPNVATSTPPTDLLAVRGDKTVLLSWISPSEVPQPGSGQVEGVAPISDYEIHESSDNFSTDDTTLTDGVSTATSTLVAGLTNGTLYYFRVVAVNSAGTSSPSNIVSATPLGVPSAPVMHEGYTPNIHDNIKYVIFTWDAPTDTGPDASVGTGGTPLTNYQFQYSSSSSFTLLDQDSLTPPNETSYTTRTSVFKYNVPYYFRVSALNSEGTSPVSNVTTASPGLPPPPPLFH